MAVEEEEAVENGSDATTIAIHFQSVFVHVIYGENEKINSKNDKVLDKAWLKEVRIVILFYINWDYVLVSREMNTRGDVSVLVDKVKDGVIVIILVVWKD